MPNNRQFDQKRFADRGAYKGGGVRKISCAVAGLALAALWTGDRAFAVRLPPPAAIIVDAATGQVVFEHNADAPRPPASLAKMMTLYLTFEAINTDKLSSTTLLSVSATAAARPRSKLGLKAGQSVSVHTAIVALVTKSANDVATVLAEAIAGSESKFVDRMNEKSKFLQLSSTRFTNPSGLHDSKQTTTARDMTMLARALMRDFPTEYAYFSVRDFEHEGRSHRNHNRLLGTYAGTDGIKTGYVRAAGYHLAASVRRDGQHLIGILMGSRTAKRRDKNLAYLLDNAFDRLRSDPVSSPLPIAETFLSAYLAGWGVQVGAFSKSSSAQQFGQAAAHLMTGLALQATLSVVEVEDQGRILHRARVIGMTQDDAWRACAHLHAANMACMPVEPDGEFVAFN